MSLTEGKEDRETDRNTNPQGSLPLLVESCFSIPHPGGFQTHEVQVESHCHRSISGEPDFVSSVRLERSVQERLFFSGRLRRGGLGEQRLGWLDRGKRRGEREHHWAFGGAGRSVLPFCCRCQRRDVWKHEWWGGRIVFQFRRRRECRGGGSGGGSLQEVTARGHGPILGPRAITPPGAAP